MTTEPKPYIRPVPKSKDQLREMLAQAVRNTLPELNPVTIAAPKPKAKRRGRPTKGLLPKRPTNRKNKA